jgi:ubiquinone/menaquinone biosynthesis C-methylase UbiE
VFPTLADAYDRYIGRYSNQLARQLMSMVGIAGGQRVLDVGCGPGSLTTALVERLGPGSVSAVDPSEPYAKACRTRARGAGVVVARAQALPFAHGEFDVVLAQLVVNLLDDPEAGVREMARVTLSGGVVAAAVWASDGMPLLRAFWDAAAAVAPDAVAGVGESGRVGYHYEQLADLWQRCALMNPSVVQIEANARYEDFDDLWAPIEAGVGRSGEVCRLLDASRRATLRDEMHRRLGAPVASFQLTARAWCIQGTTSS